MKTLSIFCAAILCGIPLLCAEEYVYEGRKAAEWAADLKGGKNPEKAQHALSKLGKDAVPALIPLLTDPDEKIRVAASNVLSNMQQSKDAVPTFLGLLKDPNFEVRRTAVRVLGRFKDNDEVSGALKQMLEDRDKAVAEAAEEALKQSRRDEQVAMRQFLEPAVRALQEGDVITASVLLKNARSIPNDDPNAKMMMRELEERIEQATAERNRTRFKEQRNQQLDVVIKQAQIQLERRDFERAMLMQREAERIAPDDPRVFELQKMIAKAQGNELKFEKKKLPPIEMEQFEKKKAPPMDKGEMKKKVPPQDDAGQF